MLDIQGTLVSLDLVERFFCCDLESCLGACCIEGDAGAPITKDEYELLKKILPTVWDDLLPRAQEEIAAHGVAYVDQEGDLVTNIIDGKNCVFTCYEPGGLCSCAIERAYRNGRIAWRKPLSCFLYPVRVKRLTDGTFAVNTLIKSISFSLNNALLISSVIYTSHSSSCQRLRKSGAKVQKNLETPPLPRQQISQKTFFGHFSSGCVLPMTRTG